MVRRLLKSMSTIFFSIVLLSGMGTTRVLAVSLGDFLSYVSGDFTKGFDFVANMNKLLSKQQATFPGSRMSIQQAQKFLMEHKKSIIQEHNDFIMHHAVDKNGYRSQFLDRCGMVLKDSMKDVDVLKFFKETPFFPFSWRSLGFGFVIAFSAAFILYVVKKTQESRDHKKDVLKNRLRQLQNILDVQDANDMGEKTNESNESVEN